MSEKEWKPDSTSTCTAKYKAWRAAHHNYDMKIEQFGISDTYVVFSEFAKSSQLKIDYTTLLLLRDCINRWYQDEIINRGKE